MRIVGKRNATVKKTATIQTRYHSTEKSGPIDLFGEQTRFPVLSWTKGVSVEESAQNQLRNVANLPFIFKHIAVMPDVHWGMGATVGSVIPTVGAIIPAAVGVDIGCGMVALRTSLTAENLPDNLKSIRNCIEKAVPHGVGQDIGSFSKSAVPKKHVQIWEQQLEEGYNKIIAKHPKVANNTMVSQLGTLGGGNHFIEICLDEDKAVWLMLHSGSRGTGNKIGTYFIDLAKKDMKRHSMNLPDADLSYFREGSSLFDDYVHAVEWAQNYAKWNRAMMMDRIIETLRKSGQLPQFTVQKLAVNCHHNYVQRELHFGTECLVTRKGAVNAAPGALGIIPGSMGTRSYIVRGKGNPDSFHSCSHGAGRRMSRNEAKKKFSVEDHEKATQGVECKKDVSVLDETPMAYKDIDKVMESQEDLVEILHILKQIVCVKG